MQFTPDTTQTPGLVVPWFEDAQADYTPGYATTKSPERLQEEVSAILYKFGATAPVFVSGRYADDKRRTRYGYEVRFTFGGAPAVIRVAALPIHRETPARKRQALAHALYNVREQLQTALATLAFTPGAAPLVQHLLVPGTGETVAAHLLARHALPNLNPQLPSVSVVIDGEIEELA